jgi:DNA-3-methyladenine glycosylase II
MTNFMLEPRGPFSMAPVRQLQCGFLRGSRTCDADPETVKLAFPLDGSFDIAGVRLQWDGARIHGEVVGDTDPVAVATQVARVLAVDHDATPFSAVLHADAVLRRIAAARPGFRPVVSYSPYVMAGWSVMSQRTRMAQAAALQIAIAIDAGDVSVIDGERVAAFPQPETFLARSGFPGVAAEKWRRLQEVAVAALDGELDRERLLAMPYEQARATLRAIRGVGDWTADAILIRGCGPTDLLPLREPTVHEAVALAYGLGHLPSDAEVIAIAESWRPFRTWVSVLLVSELFSRHEQGAVHDRAGRRPQRGDRRPRAARSDAGVGRETGPAR